LSNLGPDITIEISNIAEYFYLCCSAYNVYLRCVHIVIEKTTGKPCAISSLDVWMPYVTEAYSNFTKEDAQGCKVHIVGTAT
jgi:hypothetical protein